MIPRVGTEVVTVFNMKEQQSKKPMKSSFIHSLLEVRK